jgi:hypothetical protein
MSTCSIRKILFPGYYVTHLGGIPPSDTIFHIYSCVRLAMAYSDINRHLDDKISVTKQSCPRRNPPPRTTAFLFGKKVILARNRARLRTDQRGYNYIHVPPRSGPLSITLPAYQTVTAAHKIVSVNKKPPFFTSYQASHRQMRVRVPGRRCRKWAAR